MKRLFLIMVLAAGFVGSVNAQQQKLYSVFMYTFTKHISWPNNSGDFIIEVLGDDVLYNELSNISKVKKVGTRSMNVKKISSLSASSNPHMLFIGKSTSGDINNAKSKIGKETLLVTDDMNYSADFHHINFIMNGGKVNFEIYESEINNTNLKMSGQLKSLGIVK